MGRSWTIGRVKDGIRRRMVKAYRSAMKVPAKYDAFNRVHSHFVDARTQAPVIVDIGAHHGESIERFTALFPGATIHSFEADSDNFKMLQQKFGARTDVTLNNIGAGSAPGVKIFHRNRKSDTSSFNPVNTDSEWTRTRSKQANVAVGDFTEKSYEVKIGTIDEYMARNGIAYIDVLKIDTQGFEDEVLKGCQAALRDNRVGVVETELILGDIYQKTLSFLEIEALLLPYGYKLYAIDRGGSLLDSPGISLNLIYVCKARLQQKKAA